MSSIERRLEHIECREVRVPFATSFRHASADRSETSSVWVEALGDDGVTTWGEGCPRPYVTGETLDSARAFLADVRDDVCRRITSLATLRAWVHDQAELVDRNPAAWCAIELAILDGLGRRAGVTVESLLGLPPLAGPFRYTAVLGDAAPEPFHALATRYRTLGFADFKVKLSGDVVRDRAKLEVFRECPGPAVRVRADANNVWESADAAIDALRSLAFPLFALEEPIAAGRYAELGRIADTQGMPVVLDESLLRRAQFDQLSGPCTRWLVNVRVSKMGGIIRSLGVVAEAGARGIGIVVGAQVGETSLLSRAALTVAHAAGAGVVAQEGAFGTHLLRRDIIDPPLMFGPAGLVSVSDFPWLHSAGLGILEPRL